MVTSVKTRNRLREVREAVGMSQSELGRRIDKSEPTVNRYERGHRRPDRETWNAIADVLGVPLKDLFVNLSAAGVGVNEKDLEGETDGDVWAAVV